MEGDGFQVFCLGFPPLGRDVLRSLGLLMGWGQGLWSPRRASGVTACAARWALGPFLHPKPSFQEKGEG